MGTLNFDIFFLFYHNVQSQTYAERYQIASTENNQPLIKIISGMRNYLISIEIVKRFTHVHKYNSETLLWESVIVS